MTKKLIIDGNVPSKSANALKTFKARAAEILEGIDP